MDIRLDDTLIMKKPHPCGCREFTVLRTGMDIKFRCNNCGHEIMIPRRKAEKGIKQIIHAEDSDV